MIIAIAPDKPVDNECFLVNKLFEKGLDLYHIRKYGLSEKAMQKYVERIDRRFRHRLVMHSHFHLTGNLGIKRLHFREIDRVQDKHLFFQGHYLISTSVHSIGNFNTLSPTWDYAFFSPIFPSISKRGYGVKNDVLNQLKYKTNSNVRLIGLGGIDENNFHQVLEAGADGIALLGSIWQSEKPLNMFLKCKARDNF